MNKFKVGEVVLYQNGTSFELGIVKEVIERELKVQKKQDGFPPAFPPTVPTNGVEYVYRVWYHTGDTTAVTGEYLLHKLRNAYAFLILRRTADTDSINDTPARILAASIIENTKLNSLKNESYYECEDKLTKLLNEYKGG